MAPGGVAELYGLSPDIVTYGKALGQGFPIAAIAGPNHIMESIEYGKVLHYGSHNAPRLGLFATKTMLEEMSRDNYAGYKKMSEIGDQMTKRLNQAAADTGHNMRVQNFGSMFHPVFTDLDEITNYRDFCQTVDLAKYAEFSQKMRNQGIFFSGNKILHNLSCTDQLIRCRNPAQPQPRKTIGLGHPCRTDTFFINIRHGCRHALTLLVSSTINFVTQKPSCD